jgi:hypothetical protein
LAAFLLFGLNTTALPQSTYSLHSPDGRIAIEVRSHDRLRYTVSLKGKALLVDNALSLKIDGRLDWTRRSEPKENAR